MLFNIVHFYFKYFFEPNKLTAMNKNLSFSDLQQRYQNTIRELEFFKSVTEQDLSLKPAPSIWSVAEIFEHILIFNKMYQKMIHQALESANDKHTDSDRFNARFFIRPFIAMIRPPYKMKIKTLKPMKPSGQQEIHPHSGIDELIKFNQDQITLLKELENKKLNLDRIKGKNKVFKIKMTVTEFFLMMDAHQERHIWQAQQLLEKMSKI